MYLGKDGDVYRARFHAKYLRILSFGYTVALKAEVTGDGYNSAVRRISALMGGIYHYEGHADATNSYPLIQQIRPWDLSDAEALRGIGTTHNVLLLLGL